MYRILNPSPKQNTHPHTKVKKVCEQNVRLLKREEGNSEVVHKMRFTKYKISYSFWKRLAFIRTVAWQTLYSKIFCPSRRRRLKTWSDEMLLSSCSTFVPFSSRYSRILRINVTRWIENCSTGRFHQNQNKVFADKPDYKEKQWNILQSPENCRNITNRF